MELTESDKIGGVSMDMTDSSPTGRSDFRSATPGTLDRSGEQVQRAPGSLDKMDLEVGARLDEIEKKLRRIT